MFGYLAFYHSKRLEVFANSTFEAQTIAAKQFKAKKQYEVSVYLCEKDGKEVVHSTSEVG